MHRSRIGVVLIDAPEETHQPTLDFWSAATGRAPVAEGDAPYWALGHLGTARLEVQRTGPGTPPRVHLDIETDDVGAEVARLIAIGATVAEPREDYTIMRDPAGLLFCVVPVWTGDDFAPNATTWT